MTPAGVLALMLTLLLMAGQILWLWWRVVELRARVRSLTAELERLESER